MAKKNKNAQYQNQYYSYDPMYGFVPVDGQNDINATQNPQDLNQNNTNAYGPAFGYGQGLGYGRGFHGPFHNGPMNPMQFQHSMRMNAMQEEINQLKMAMNPNAQANKNTVSPEKIQEIYTVMNDISQGKAGPEKLLPYLQNTSADFYKGLALGAGAILLFNCTPLKDMLTNLLGSSLANLANFMPQNADDLDDGFDDDGFDDDGFDDVNDEILDEEKTSKAKKQA